MTGFKPGDRVHEWGHDYTPSTTGTVQGIQPDGTILVLWDDGPVITAHFPQHLEPLGEPMSKRTDFLDADGSPMTIEGRADHKNWAIKFASTYREFTPEDAPAIALAILEAAGITQQEHDCVRDSSHEALEQAAMILGDYIREVQQIAEAAAQRKAEKEAEAAAQEIEDAAVEIDAAHLFAHSSRVTPPWEELSSAKQNNWRKVARAARELHGVTA